nr:MAG TPA: hypothetical protein [Crassvirales sp.]
MIFSRHFVIMLPPSNENTMASLSSSPQFSSNENMK